QHLILELNDYINWYNRHRIHGTLGYMSPINYRRLSLKKAV
ncbi:IS3 family transposase, partial [Paenibacillus larvae]